MKKAAPVIIAFIVGASVGNSVTEWAAKRHIESLNLYWAHVQAVDAESGEHLNAGFRLAHVAGSDPLPTAIWTELGGPCQLVHMAVSPPLVTLECEGYASGQVPLNEVSGDLSASGPQEISEVKLKQVQPAAPRDAPPPSAPVP